MRLFLIIALSAEVRMRSLATQHQEPSTGVRQGGASPDQVSLVGKKLRHAHWSETVPARWVS